jgi:glycine/D-amino acid oxidase-like deaminating enzyme
MKGLITVKTNGLPKKERLMVSQTAITVHGKITSRHIVLATHFPLVNIQGLYFVKLYQHRSYVIALEYAPPLGGMYLGEREDGHSFRMYGNLFFIGGDDHKTGKRGGGYTELRGFAKQNYPTAVEKFHWATQDCITLDKVPYIGQHRAGVKNLYVEP